MKETKKLVITITIIVAVILMIPFAYYINYSKGEKIVNAVDELFADEAVNLVFIGRPTCGYCEMLQPILDKLADQYEFTYNYVNIDLLNKSQFDKVIKKFDIDEATFGTPYLAVVDNGEIKAEQQGYVEEEELFTFLQDNNFIADEEGYTPEETTLTEINLEEYNKILSAKTKEIVIIAQTGCGACESAKPVLEEIADEYDLKINWFDIRKMETDEEYNSFINSLDFYKNEEWGTPLALIIANNEVVDSNVGFYSKDAYVDFLIDNGFIK